MIAFCLRRALWMLLTLWIVFTATFFLMRAVPGGPFDSERALEPEIKLLMEKRYNLDKPLYKQYGLELWKDLHPLLARSTPSSGCKSFDNRNGC